MKKIFLLILILFLSVKANQFKRYDIESGFVKYEAKIRGGSGEVEISQDSKKIIKFKNYGAKELSDENVTMVQKMFGNKVNQSKRQMTLFDNGKVYFVDFDTKVVYEGGDIVSGLLENSIDGDIKNLGMDILKKMGGKKIGQDEVLGYKCDIWEISGVKQCFYKGVLLKLDADMGGMSIKQIATEAKFNTPIKDEEFKLPNFPKKDISEMMKQLSNIMNATQN